jgi:TP901 family phage tail tape measure protein
MTEAARLEGVIALVGLQQAKSGLVGLGRQVDKTQTSLDGLATGTRGTGQGMRTLAKDLDSAGRRMQATGGTLTRRMTLPLVGLGLAAVKVGSDFEAQMSKVEAKSGASAQQLERLRQQALRLGADTSFSAREAAQGMEELAAAGMKPQQVLAAMPGLLDAAAASGEGVAQVASIMSNSLAQFSLEADQSGRIADVLAKASNETQGSITSMGEALKYAGTGASQMGLDIEQTTALLSKMVKAGIDGGQAGTALRMGLLKLATVPPARALEKLADPKFGKLGDIWKSAASVPDKLKQMSGEMEKLDGTSRAAAAGIIFGSEASTGMLEAMRGGPAAIDKWTESMRNAGGEAKRMGETMRNNLRGDLEGLGGSLETALIGLFSAGDGPMRPFAVTR